MNVANLELCKELYELSGGVLLSEWGSTYFYYTLSGNVASGWYINPNGGTNGKDDIPAYDLGCLLRKLQIDVYEQRNYLRMEYFYNVNKWGIGFVGHDFEDADTPEDAAAKLCIELIKQGVLKP